MSTTIKFSPGSMIAARGREWIVMPGSRDDLLIVRPIDGTVDETTGILTALEQITSASFSLPSTEAIGDDRSCRLLRNAIRLGVRNSAGPFRSFGRIAVDPRPYQFVPLMLALKQQTVRILIADDVGVGKTIEASLIVRELIDRGECQRFCVLCPPYLAEQWERELYEKFHIETTLVLSSTVNRLEKQCASDESIFDVYPHTVVSIDFIKSDKRRQEFLQTAPELIIIDEAHSVGYDSGGISSSRHQRHQLAKDLCENKNRNIILITATPHSGNENAFRSLLGLLNKSFLDYPEDLSGKENEKYRREIAKYLVQRRRKDIETFLDEETVFPVCEAKEEPWSLSAPYKALFDKTLAFAKEMIEDQSGDKKFQRVRWWSALSLLRALASSPAAAKTTLLNRNQALEANSTDEIEQLGQKFVLDMDVDDTVSVSDIPLGGDCDSDEAAPTAFSEYRRQKLREMAEEAKNLFGDNDAKLLKLTAELKKFVKDGFHPIVFCRFIPTVDYLCDELRRRLPNDFEVVGVSGLLPPEERERRIEKLGQAEKRILICTDCLSEGINLQESFNAVIHYDLSWNPTRHEQREGRVDRFGQASKTVRMSTFYGTDNHIDGVVLNILLRKHKQIKTSLGISVPVPANTKEVIEAIFAGLLISKDTRNSRRKNNNPVFPEMKEFLDDLVRDEATKLHQEWENQSEKEKRSRTLFAQDRYASRTEEIKNELIAMRKSIGSSNDVRDFTLNVLKDSGAFVTQDKSNDTWAVDLTGIPENLRDYLPRYDCWTVRFDLPVEDGVEYLSRTHAFIEGLSDYITNTALDSSAIDSLAKRCGVIRTTDVTKRTTLLLLRYRFHLMRQRAKDSIPLLAEDVQIVGFSGAPDQLDWLSEDEVEKVLAARPSGNIARETACRRIQEVLDHYPSIQEELNHFAERHAEQLKEAHQRVRTAMNDSQGVDVQPELPPDVIGIYVYLP